MLSGKDTTKRMTVCGLLISSAFVLSYVEQLIPVNISIYGFKIGLANIIIIFAIYKFHFIDSFIVLIAKIFISGFLFGGPVYLMYSFFGGILSYLSMLAVKRLLNIITVSVIGAVCFNIGQIICACIVFSSLAIASYLPVLLIVSVITGILTGILSDIAIKRIKI